MVATARGKRVGRSSGGRRVVVRLAGFAKGPVRVTLRVTGRKRGRTTTVTQVRRYTLCRPGPGRVAG